MAKRVGNTGSGGVQMTHEAFAKHLLTAFQAGQQGAAAQHPAAPNPAVIQQGAPQPAPAAEAPRSQQTAQAAANQSFKAAGLTPNEVAEATAFCETLSTGKYEGKPLGLAGVIQMSSMFATSDIGQRVLSDPKTARGIHNVLEATPATQFWYQAARGVAKWLGTSILGSAQQEEAQYAEAKQPVPDEVRARGMMGHAFGLFSEHGIEGLGQALQVFNAVPPEHRGVFGHALTALSWIDTFLNGVISNNLAQIAGKTMAAAIQGQGVANIELQSANLGERVGGILSAVTGFFRRALGKLNDTDKPDEASTFMPAARVAPKKATAGGATSDAANAAGQPPAAPTQATSAELGYAARPDVDTAPQA